jgi:hypothetical protein
MKKVRRISLSVIIIAIWVQSIVSCQVHDPYKQYTQAKPQEFHGPNYNTEVTILVGNKMIWDYYYGTGYSWTIQQELSYRGRTGNTICLHYEARGNKQPDSQDLQYDISKSDIVGFRNWRIKVLEATNESIKFIRLDDAPNK